MTPKEKAQELVDKFKPYMYPFGSGSAYLSGDRSDNHVLPDARKCATMCVDELIEYADATSYGENAVSQKEYWTKVRIEILNSI